MRLFLTCINRNNHGDTGGVCGWIGSFWALGSMLFYLIYIMILKSEASVNLSRDFDNL